MASAISSCTITHRIKKRRHLACCAWWGACQKTWRAPRIQTRAAVGKRTLFSLLLTANRYFSFSCRRGGNRQSSSSCVGRRWRRASRGYYKRAHFQNLAGDIKQRCGANMIADREISPWYAVSRACTGAPGAIDVVSLGGSRNNRIRHFKAMIK